MTENEQQLWQEGERPPLAALDTDGDGLADEDEAVLGLDPLDPEDGYVDADEDGYDEAWEWYIGSDPLDQLDPDDGDFGYGFSPHALGSAAMLSDPPPTPPSVGDSTFDGGRYDYKYQDYRFYWIASIDDWTPVTGNFLETGSYDGRNFVELEANGGTSGIQRKVDNAVAGSYLLRWSHQARPVAIYGGPNRDCRYHVRILVKTGGGETEIFKSSPEITPPDAWQETACGFKVTPEQLPPNSELWVQFIVADGANDSKGAWIDEPKIGLVNLEIHNGQAAANPVPELEEETVGAFTVANLNNTDADGTIDKDDDEVKQGTAGSDEVDLMRLVIRGPNGGRMKVTVAGGSVEFWESSTKETKIEKEQGGIFIDGAQLPKTVWVEATNFSAAVRDIVLSLGYEAGGGQITGDLDQVKATAVWVEPGANGIITAGNNLFDLNDLGAKDYFNNQLDSKFGIFNSSPAKLHYSYAIGVEFKVKPAGIGNETAVEFDVTRQRETAVWVRDNVGWFGNQQDMFPANPDEPNDDNNPADEDNEPTNDNIYSLDNVVVPFIVAPAERIVKRGNFREFVRVRLDGQGFQNQNGTVEGSRCSSFQNWRMRGDISLLNGNWILSPGGSNKLQGGHAPLGNHP